MVTQVSEMESKADKITKEVERSLYEETLIPDARSDCFTATGTLR